MHPGAVLRQAGRTRATGAILAAAVALGSAAVGAASPAPASAYPPADSRYLDYAEMVDAIEAVEAANPAIVELFSIGTSHEGRELWAAKVSDNVARDEPEPEVVFDAGMHGREHMSTEMAVALLRNLTDGYGTNARITDMVDEREIYILFNLNPDGSEFDHRSGTYQSWRKNRQPTPGSTFIGTDINRNFGYRWGTNPLNAPPSADTYRGPSAWTTPEAAAFRRFVEGRMVGGEQQIRVHVTFHQYGRVVLYPYGYTHAAVPDDMTADDHDVLVSMAAEMASRSGYASAQSSAWAGINVGNQMDWLYATYRVMTFTFEMGDTFYMPDEAIATETGRNMESAYYAIEQASCPYAVIGRAAEHCPPDWVTRQAGIDRYDTAAAVSRAAFPRAGVPAAYVATGQNFPDALAGGVAAGLDGAPILLVRRTSIPDATTTELARLRPGRIVVLGGEAVVSSGVADALRSHATSSNVTRLAGADRYATAAAVSRDAFPVGASVAFVATGSNFPDGLAAVPAAVSERGPLLLVTRDAVPSQTGAELRRLGLDRIVVLGGTDVVSDAVVSQLRSFADDIVTRVSGHDRYATAAAIARVHFPGERAAAYLATGRGFADALSGGPAAGMAGAPMLLATRDHLPAVTAARLDALRPDSIVVLGGTSVVSREVAAVAALAAR